MVLLVRCNISKQKKELRKLLVFFEAVSALEPHSIKWSISYDRNSQTYRMMGNNPISLKMLDLNCKFSDIAAQLDRIAESVQLLL